MKNRNALISFLFLVTVTCKVLASEQEPVIPEDLQKEFASKRVSVDSIAENSCVQKWLQKLVTRRGHGVASQDLYVSKVGTDRWGERFLRVYWQTDKSIVIFLIEKLGCDESTRLDDADAQLELEWLETKARIDLKKDVVPTSEDVGSSTYLVAKPWVNAVIDDCKKNGRKISLAPQR